MAGNAGSTTTSNDDTGAAASATQSPMTTSAHSASDFLFFPSSEPAETDALSQALLSSQDNNLNHNNSSHHREEAGLFNDPSERLLFEDDWTSASNSQNVFAVSPPPLPPTSLLRRHSSGGSRSRRSRPWTSSVSQRPELNGLNYLNVVTYALHLFVSWGVGVWGLDGLVETRVQIGMRYDTLVTPSPFAYWIWYPILVLEAVFAVAQLFPHFRGRPIVQAGTGFYFFYTFLLQTAWTLFFAFELFIGSFVSVVAALFSLLSLLASQQQTITSTRSGGGGDAVGGGRWHHYQRLEYYFFQFPFFLHTGWMIVVTLHHFSLLFRAQDCDASLQLAVNVVCLALLVPVALLSLAGPLRGESDFVIPCVMLWAYVSYHNKILQTVIVAKGDDDDRAIYEQGALTLLFLF